MRAAVNAWGYGDLAATCPIEQPSATPVRASCQTRFLLGEDGCMNLSDQSAYGWRHARRYRQGRDLPSEAMASGAEAIARRGPDEAQLIVDLGAGTGRFSLLVAERLGSHVLAIEPSPDMIREVDPMAVRVSWVRAGAECLPIADRSCDVVWASQGCGHGHIGWAEPGPGE